MNLIEFANCFLNESDREEFRDSHVAPSSDTRSVNIKIKEHGDFSLDEVARGYHSQPSDYFDPKNGPRDYMYNDKSGMESFVAINNIIRAYNNNKIFDRKITVYRAVPKDIPNDTLQKYDWVSPSSAYAIDHGEHRFGDGEYKIIKQDVSPKELWWDSNDIREWGYDPS